jgi:hypothetical protein
VKACLEKDPADRWQDARDVVAELRWIAEGGADSDLGGSAQERDQASLVAASRSSPGVTAVILLAWPAYL